MGAYEINFEMYENNGRDEVPELVEWFSVSGDMDDFIYFGEDKTCSER